MTDEERAVAAVQAKADQDGQAAAEVAARRDRAMAESYATEEDLRRAFGERIGVMDETIKASQLGVEGPPAEPDQPARPGRRERTVGQAGAEEGQRQHPDPA